MFPMMESVTVSRAGHRRAARILRIIARVIGVLAAAFFVMLLIADVEIAVKSQGFEGITSEWLFIIIPLIVALAAFFIAWRWELTGGILLLAAYFLLSLSPSVHSLFYSEEPRFYDGMFYFASPFFVSGVLFIIASQIGKSDSGLKRENVAG